MNNVLYLNDLYKEKKKTERTREPSYSGYLQKTSGNTCTCQLLGVQIVKIHLHLNVMYIAKNHKQALTFVKPFALIM
jgi:hypothetical protein